MGALLRATLAGGGGMIKAARQLVFPDRCPQCGELVASQGGLCSHCWRETPFIMGLVCDLCGAPQIGEADGPVHCDACRSHPRPWLQGRAALEYRGGARRLVLAFKHGDRLDLGPLLAGWMAPRTHALVTPDTLLVPVPIHWRRLISRRYNQAAVLSRLLGRELGLPHLPDALIRTRATAPLAEGGFAERAAALENAIAVNPRHAARLAGRPVLLVDDVMTSGATLHACAMQLQHGGVPELRVIALARASHAP